MMLGLVVVGCTRTERVATPSSTTMPLTTTTTSTTITVTTSTATTATVSPTTAADTTAATAPPVTADPEVLAGARVLCTFSGATVPEDVLDLIAEGRAAGVLLFEENLPSIDVGRTTTTAIQAAAARSPSGAPAIVAVDQEGGIVARVAGPPSSSASDMGTWPIASVEAEATATARNLLTWGINVDLAPVADVARPGTFEDRQHRSFSGDPAVAGADVAAFVTGLRDGGVASTLKHFPGLGSVQTTTDDAPAVVSLDVDELTAVDLVPFGAGIAAGTDLVMMSSAVYPALDDAPAVMSPTVIDDVLRGQLGFGGVVVSDALDTPALASSGTLAEIAVGAAAAGVDLLIAGEPTACAEMHHGVAAAIADGTLPAERAAASVARLDALRRGLAAEPLSG